MIVERATDADLESLVLLQERLIAEDAGLHDPQVDLEWAQREGPADIQNLLDDEPSVVLVARSDDTVVGFVAGYVKPASGPRRDVRYGVLRSLYVLPDHRKAEVGRSLVRAFSDWALAEGCVEAHVESYVDNAAAQALYQGNGFNVRSVSRVEILEAGTDRYSVNDKEPWYGVRCHFQGGPWKSSTGERFGKGKGEHTYEERVTLWRATGLDHAIDRAEAEAVEYANFHDAKYLNACDSYHLGDSGFAVDGKEVFSVMRRSDLNASDYLDRFFFTGAENSVR